MSNVSHSIAHSDPAMQELMEDVKSAPSLAGLILAALALGRAVAVKVAEEVLNECGQAADRGRRCRKCGKKLESQGLKQREVMTLIGRVKWRRRVRRCPVGCENGQVAPSDEALGLQAYQQTSDEIKWLACALAVFVPFETAAVLLGMLTGVGVCGKSIWLWVQASGQAAMAQLEAQLEALASGELPEAETQTHEIKALPLLIGADGVMVPLPTRKGHPTGQDHLAGGESRRPGAARSTGHPNGPGRLALDPAPAGGSLRRH